LTKYTLNISFREVLNMGTLALTPGEIELENAIAQEEGYYANTPTVPQLRNNPCDVTSGGQVATFDTIDEGWDACTNQINSALNGSSQYYSPDESLSDFASTWTGDTSGQAASNLESILQQPATATLSSLTGLGNSQSTSTSALPSQTTVSTSGGNNPPSWWSSLFSFAGNAKTPSGALIRGVAVLAGLVLIAGAVFGFDKVQTAIVGAAKTAGIAAS
jgi:hypothetical protein